ncbi:hypothetical protein ACFE04_006157 [Oxalis oulophora]
MNYLNVGTGTSLQLDVLCKYKSNDLGNHIIGKKFVKDFDIQVDNLGKEPIFCTFAWEKGFHTFYIYREDRDGPCQECIWAITPEKPCRLFSGQTEETCFKWII